MEKLKTYFKRYKLHHISIERLLLDPENPRLHEKDASKNSDELLTVMKEQFDLPELAYSIATNGYFQEEPMIAIPTDVSTLDDLLSDDPNPEEFMGLVNDNNLQFIVVEGNRRLSTVKLLLDGNLRDIVGARNWPNVNPDYVESLSNLPVVLYTDRSTVASYIGIRHIGGLKKWEPYEKARYVKSLREDRGLELDSIQKMVGDKGNSIRKSYLCYQLISIIQNESEIPETVEKAKDRFSYLLLSLGQTAIKNYLGITDSYKDIDFENPIAEDKKDNLKNLFSWLFGEGPKIPAVISESRDITNYISPILKAPRSTEWLESTRNLIDSYDRSEGDKELLLKYIIQANDKLGNVAKTISDELIDDNFKSQFKSVEEQVTKIKKLIPTTPESTI